MDSRACFDCGTATTNDRHEDGQIYCAGCLDWTKQIERSRAALEQIAAEQAAQDAADLAAIARAEAAKVAVGAYSKDRIGDLIRPVFIPTGDEAYFETAGTIEKTPGQRFYFFRMRGGDGIRVAGGSLKEATRFAMIAVGKLLQERDAIDAAGGPPCGDCGNPETFCDCNPESCERCDGRNDNGREISICSRCETAIDAIERTERERENAADAAMLGEDAEAYSPAHREDWEVDCAECGFSVCRCATMVRAEPEPTAERVEAMFAAKDAAELAAADDLAARRALGKVAERIAKANEESARVAEPVSEVGRRHEARKTGALASVRNAAHDWTLDAENFPGSTTAIDARIRLEVAVEDAKRAGATEAQIDRAIAEGIDDVRQEERRDAAADEWIDPADAVCPHCGAIPCHCDESVWNAAIAGPPFAGRPDDDYGSPDADPVIAGDRWLDSLSYYAE